MDDLIAGLYVIAITILVVIAIFWFTNRSKTQKELKIRQLAEAHNWIFEPIQESLTWGYRLKSPAWILESQSQSRGSSPDSGSSNIFKATFWKTQSRTLPENQVFIGPRISSIIPGELGSFPMHKAIQALMGDQTEDMQEVSLNNISLGQRYLVFARYPSDAHDLLNPISQEQLVAWNHTPPVIKLSSQELEIELQGNHLENPTEILNLIHLGESFLKLEAK